MARFIEHQKALELRKQGKSYSEIKKVLGISKSTLSDWLHDYPLTYEQIDKLSYHNATRIERYRTTMREKKDTKFKIAYDKQKKMIFPINNHNLFIAGLFLYWGEGSKSKYDRICLSNTNPAIIKFFIYWSTQSLRISKEKVRIQLHLYSDMNIRKELLYWSKLINIPLKHFYKPYIKNSLTTNINHKGCFGHGTCNVNINDVNIDRIVLSSIKAVEDKYK